RVKVSFFSIYFHSYYKRKAEVCHSAAVAGNFIRFVKNNRPMASFNQFNRLFIIAEKLHASRKKGFSKIELIEHIVEVTNDQRPISDRTFARDMQMLRSSPFYLNIDCVNNVYKLKEQDWDGLDYRQLIEPFHVFSALHANAELSDVIFPERYSNKGTANLNPLLNAIRNNRQVKITYTKHGEE